MYCDTKGRKPDLKSLPKVQSTGYFLGEVQSLATRMPGELLRLGSERETFCHWLIPELVTSLELQLCEKGPYSTPMILSIPVY